MRKSTMVELVAALEVLPITPGIQEMIDEAKAGEYHDYKNKKYVCGKMEVVNKLHLELLNTKLTHLVHALNTIRLAVIDGEYDEPADEEDLEFLKSTTPRNLWPMLGLN